MQDYLNVQLDIHKMSLEEMKETRDKLREILDNLNHQIVMIKIANRKSSKPLVQVNQAEESRNKLREILDNLNHHIAMNKIAKRKYASKLS